MNSYKCIQGNGIDMQVKLGKALFYNKNLGAALNFELIGDHFL